MFAVAPMRRTGSSSSANFESVGLLAPEGSFEPTSLTFRWASCRDTLTSALIVNSSDTIETPSDEVAYTLATLSMPETASSMIFVTLVSTSAGDAPG